MMNFFCLFYEIERENTFYENLIASIDVGKNVAENCSCLTSYWVAMLPWHPSISKLKKLLSFG